MYVLLIVLVCYAFGTPQHEQNSYVVDIGPLVAGGTENEVLRASHQLDKALRENGLVIITGHGISHDIIRSTFDAAYVLFELDAASKSAASIVNDETSFGRGYLGFGDESGLSSHFEPKEGYSYGSQTIGQERSLLNIMNKWPSGLAGSQVQALERLYEEEVRVAKTIVGSLSALFNCTEPSATGSAGSLAEVAEGGELISLMRLFHYFHQKSDTVQQHVQRLKQQAHATGFTAGVGEGAQAGQPEAQANMLGSSPHTDWGFLTVILADEVGGLQFIPKGRSLAEDSWVDVPFVPDSLIINGGDYLKLISGGVYHSPIHRVLSPGSRSSSRSGPSGAGSSAASAKAPSHDGDNLEVPAVAVSNAQENAKESERSGDSDSDGYKDRYSFVFFFYPAYSSPVSASVLAHCAHYLSTPAENQEHILVAHVPQGSAPSGAEQAGAHEYNTLLLVEPLGGTSANDDSPPVPAFGDYVIRKWRGVYRKDE